MKALIFSGSTRSGSINRKLTGALILKLEDAGFEVTQISLSDYDMPIYNGDWEDKHGAPESAKKLAAHFKSHDAVIIVSPEYNGGLPGLLKNTIDWLTRLGDMKHYHSPVFGIASCTPGAMSGIMCMRQINYILGRLGGEVLPVQCGVGNAGDAFTDDGLLARDNDIKLAEKFADGLKTRVARKG
ncbi:NADPH-dependent FMN reductase [Robiginitomaculum antarcticum]|uniref:NADPH-dependent FMN reductase n=1 Tax=Robiginitomaculum antarcticum TaxID=437507 RepID=UPI00038298E1|nr:NAD(P)H-dependent oxidoreductase [Robiginitomaculum antarcticum]